MIKVEYNLDEAKRKMARIQKAMVENAKPIVAGLVDGEGEYSMYALMMQNVQDIVYEVYEPVMYRRKGMSGGLAGAIDTEYDGLSARVYVDGDKLLDSTLDDGSPYFWRVLKGHGVHPYDFPVPKAAFMPPRDFFTPTVVGIMRDVESGNFKAALINALNAAKSV